MRGLRDPDVAIRRKAVVAARDMAAAPLQAVQCMGAGTTAALLEMLGVSGVRGVLQGQPLLLSRVCAQLHPVYRGCVRGCAYAPGPRMRVRSGPVAHVYTYMGLARRKLVRCGTCGRMLMRACGATPRAR